MDTIDHTLSNFLHQYATFRWVLVLLVATIASFFLFKLMDTYVPKAVKAVSYRASNAKARDELLKWRRLETFMHVIIAATKVILFFGVIYAAWRVMNPTGAPVALVTASAVAVILTSSTLGPVLRDMTYGVVMIVERWYNVGDHIQVEPFASMRGVVESVTLRSTTLRGLNGEIIKVHNQNIQAIRMTPMGIKTLALDVFVKNKAKGKKCVEEVLGTIPASASMIESAFSVSETEKIADTLWRVTAVGKVVAGREWLIEDYATAAIKEADARSYHVLVHGPIVRFADAKAEKQFRRSIFHK